MDPTRFKLSGACTGEVAVGIRLYPFPHCNLHVGIIYRDPAKQPWVVHLAWHERLGHEPVGQFAAANPKLDPAEEFFLAAYFQRLALSPRNRTIPYNLKHEPDVAFDRNGNYAPPPDATGLSCATFVVAAFRSAGKDLVDTATWLVRGEPERGADEAAQEKFLTRLAAKPETRGQAERIRGEAGGPRVRPQDVAGACLEDTLPATFSQCSQNGDYIHGELTRAATTSGGRPHPQPPNPPPPGQP
jgi:hypothetical protein